MASLTLTCPHCRGPIELPATVVTKDATHATVLVKIDQSVGEKHLRECRAGRAQAEAPTLEAAPSEADLAGRIHRMLETGAFVATGGSRACTLCGTTGAVCMGMVNKNGGPCCNGCGNGNTHPMPKGDLSCAEWAADFHEGQQ
jgi:hypothetical protein